MVKILSAKQIKALDATTISISSIDSIDLMERACRAFFDWFVEAYPVRCAVGIVCGTGNNGGDGAGVARMLKESGYDVTLWVVRGGGKSTDDFEENIRRAARCRVPMFEIVAEDSTNPFVSQDVIIDAVFGSGLNRTLEGLGKWVIDSINDVDADRVSVDIPSGLMADAPSTGSIVRANFTISFQLPKLSFFLPGSYPFVGEWTTVDIGLDKNFIQSETSKYFVNTHPAVSGLLRSRSRFDHKGTYGHALLIVGSLGKMGAAILSSRAALRSGLGLLTSHIPKCGNVALQSNVPEAMVSLDRHEEIFSGAPSTDVYSTIGIGPGLGKSIDTINALRTVLDHFRKPVVLDADALNIIAENREMLHLIPPGSILTPHPKEFERIVGKWANDFERLERQGALATQLKSIVIVKGAYSTIASPEGRFYFNTTGNPGMATGGTGDVLTGILTGLLAQQYEPVEAAIIGVYLHGLAGDIAATELGMNSLVASDLIEFLPRAFLSLKKG